MTTLGQPYLSPTDRDVLRAIEQIVVENKDELEDPFALEHFITRITGHPAGVDPLALERLRKQGFVSKTMYGPLTEYRLTNDGWRYLRA